LESLVSVRNLKLKVDFNFEVSLVSRSLELDRFTIISLLGGVPFYCRTEPDQLYCLLAFGEDTRLNQKGYSAQLFLSDRINDHGNHQMMLHSYGSICSFSAPMALGSTGFLVLRLAATVFSRLPNKIQSTSFNGYLHDGLEQ